MSRIWTTWLWFPLVAWWERTLLQCTLKPLRSFLWDFLNSVFLSLPFQGFSMPMFWSGKRQMILRSGSKSGVKQKRGFGPSNPDHLPITLLRRRKKTLLKYFSLSVRHDGRIFVKWICWWIPRWLEASSWGSSLFFQVGQRIQNLVQIIQELHPAPLLPPSPQPVGLALMALLPSNPAATADEYLQFLRFPVTQMYSCLVSLLIGSAKQRNTLYSPSQTPSHTSFLCCRTSIRLVKSDIERISTLNVLYLCSYCPSCPPFPPFSLLSLFAI